MRQYLAETVFAETVFNFKNLSKTGPMLGSSKQSVSTETESKVPFVLQFAFSHLQPQIP